MYEEVRENPSRVVILSKRQNTPEKDVLGLFYF